MHATLEPAVLVGWSVVPNLYNVFFFKIVTCENNSRYFMLPYHTLIYFWVSKVILVISDIFLVTFTYFYYFHAILFLVKYIL